MFFSIIIPAYNSSGTILRCLKSISSQDFYDYEVIIINDGSIDESKNIIGKYISDKIKYKLINKENGGVSSARNKGLELAKGEYIIFLDSDDWLTDGYFSFAYDILKNGYDGLILSYYECYGSNEKIINNELVKFDESQSDFEQLFLKCVIKNSPCDKIFKRLVYSYHRIKFPEGLSVGEDSCVTHQILKNVTTIMAKENAFLKYQLDTNGITKTKVTNKKIEDIIRVVHIIEKSVTSKNKTHSYYYNMRLVIDYYFQACRELDINVNLIEKEVYRLIHNSKFSSAIAKKQKLYLFVLKVCCYLRVLRYISYMR